MGVTDQTFYFWKKKYGELGATELRRLRQLEEENRKLMQMEEDLSLDKHMLQEVIQKNSGACADAPPGDFFSRKASG